MTVKVVAVAAALAALALPAMAAGQNGRSGASARQSATKAGKQAARHHCRRHARCARVVRRSRRLAAGGPLERLLGVGPGPSTEPGPGSPGPEEPQTPAPGTPAPPRFVSVAAREFSLTLSRPLVGTGAVTVELRNSGEDPHNLVVSPEGTHSALATFSEIDPGTYERRSVSLAPGRYQLWCSLEFHEGLGMSTTLRVQ
jgi:hypothetical protein